MGVSYHHNGNTVDVICLRIPDFYLRKNFAFKVFSNRATYITNLNGQPTYIKQENREINHITLFSRLLHCIGKDEMVCIYIITNMFLEK